MKALRTLTFILFDFFIHLPIDVTILLNGQFHGTTFWHILDIVYIILKLLLNIYVIVSGIWSHKVYT